MKPIIIQNSSIPKYLSIFINISAITVYPFIISKDVMSKSTIRHERIHIEQQKELLVVFFWLLYIWYWLRGRIQGMTNSESYMNIPFEREAYRNEENPMYLFKRRPFAWKNYIN